jgi:hypothetical protein
VIFRTTGGFCLARLYADNLAAVLPGVEVSTGCDEVILSAGRDTAVVGSEMGDAGVRLRFAYGDRVCERMVAMASRPPTCPANAPEQAAFDECVTDFFVGVASTSRAMLEPGDREPPAQHSSSPQHQPEDPGEERPRTGEPPSPGDRDQDFLPGLPVKLPKIWML